MSAMIALVAILAIGWFLIANSSENEDSAQESTNQAEVENTKVVEPTSTLEPGVTPPAATPIPTPVPQPTGVTTGDRIEIQKIGVNAPLSYKVVLQGEEMPVPNGARDVAYYNFSNFYGVGGTVGKPGNAVFAGHVDLASVGPAVFYDLHKLRANDEIKIILGGQTFTYKVTSTESFDAEQNDEFFWNDLLAATSSETITLITCEGSFNSRTRQYEERRVIKAIRIN